MFSDFLPNIQTYGHFAYLMFEVDIINEMSPPPQEFQYGLLGLPGLAGKETADFSGDTILFRKRIGGTGVCEGAISSKEVMDNCVWICGQT